MKEEQKCCESDCPSNCGRDRKLGCEHGSHKCPHTPKETIADPMVERFSNEIWNMGGAISHNDLDAALLRFKEEVEGGIIEKMYNEVSGEHRKARTAYHKDSWDAGWHDALFSISKRIVALKKPLSK